MGQVVCCMLCVMLSDTLNESVGGRDHHKWSEDIAESQQRGRAFQGFPWAL